MFDRVKERWRRSSASLDKANESAAAMWRERERQRDAVKFAEREYEEVCEDRDRWKVRAECAELAVKQLRTLVRYRDADPMPPPSHLDDAGRALWFAVRFSVPEGYLLDEREQSILAMAGEKADTLAALETIVAEEGMMTRGSKGQRVVRPAVQEARLQRQSIGQLLTRLSFPDEAGTGGAASARGRHAANDREEG